MRKLKLLLAIISVSAVGCAENTIRLQSASSVAQLSNGVVQGVRSYFAVLGQRRREALVTLLATDPDCRWRNPVQILAPLRANADASDICAGRNTNMSHYTTFELNLNSVPEEALQLAATELALIAAYQSALANALEQEPSRFSEDMFFALDLVGLVQTDLAKLAGTEVNLLTDGEIAAARNLITLITTLSQEARQVADVRRIVAADGASVPAALDSLDGQLSTAQRVLDQQTNNIATTGLASHYNTHAARMGFEERQRFLRAIAASNDGAREARARVAPLQQALQQLRQGDRELRDALEGRYTPEMQRRITQLNRQRFLQVTSMLAGLLTRAVGG